MMSGKNNSDKKMLPLVHFSYKRTPIYDRPNYPFDEEMQIGLDIVYGNKTKWKIPIPLAHEIITITLIFDGIWQSDKLFERKGPLEAMLQRDDFKNSKLCYHFKF